MILHNRNPEWRDRGALIDLTTQLAGLSATDLRWIAGVVDTALRSRVTARIRTKSSHMDGFSCLTLGLSALWQRKRQRRGRHRHIEHVVPEPVDVLGLVGT